MAVNLESETPDFNAPLPDPDLEGLAIGFLAGRYLCDSEGCLACASRKAEAREKVWAAYSKGVDAGLLQAAGEMLQSASESLARATATAEGLAAALSSTPEDPKP